MLKPTKHKVVYVKRNTRWYQRLTY